MDVERALRESLAANDLTLWSASGACVVNVDEATRNLAASLVARGVAPSPDAPGFDVTLPIIESLTAAVIAVAPSPDAPGPRIRMSGAQLAESGASVPEGYFLDWDEFDEFVPVSALAASGDAPRGKLDVEGLYAAIVAELVVLWGEPSDAVSTQVRPIVARNIADRYVASESHPAKERTDGDL